MIWALRLQNGATMSQITSWVQSESLAEQFTAAQTPRTLGLGGEFSDDQIFNAETQRTLRWRRELLTTVVNGVMRRLKRERRRRKVGRAYDMALEIARFIPRGAELLDVGCGNGFISASSQRHARHECGGHRPGQ